MKNLLLLVIITCYLNSFAQNANWGTGLPITVVVNTSSLKLSVHDPILNQTKTTSLSVGSNPIYVNNDGIVTGYGNNGYMKYATYDVEQHSWKSDSKQISYSNHNGTIRTADGVVVGYGDVGYMKYATYDVEQHSWKWDSKQISYSNHDGTIQTADGVVAGYGDVGYMKYATYDIEQHTWKWDSKQISYSKHNGTIITSNGIVVGYGDTEYMKYAVYDFNLNSWKWGSKQLGNSGSISLNSGTISYTGFSSGIKGYNPNTHSWGDYSTTPTCKFIPVSFTTSSWVFMRCMSIGASSFVYNCGDGHQISRKQGWKKYNDNNTYNLDLNVSNGVTNSTCNSTINNQVGIKEYDNINFQLFPNPTSHQITISSDKNSGKIHLVSIHNSLGQNIIERKLTEQNLSIDLSDLDQGIYFVTIISPEESQTIKVFKQE